MRCHSFFVKSVARLDLFEKEGQFLVSLWRFFLFMKIDLFRKANVY